MCHSSQKTYNDESLTSATMQNNDGGGGRRRSQGPRRKSVEFATIVEEEEPNFTRLDSQQSGLSNVSIT